MRAVSAYGMTHVTVRAVRAAAVRARPMQRPDHAGACLAAMRRREPGDETDQHGRCERRLGVLSSTAGASPWLAKAEPNNWRACRRSRKRIIRV